MSTTVNKIKGYRQRIGKNDLALEDFGLLMTLELSKQIDDGQRDKNKRYDGTYQANWNGVAE